MAFCNRVFFLGKPFQPNLMFVGKATAYLSAPLQGRPQALPTNNRLGWGLYYKTVYGRNLRIFLIVFFLGKPFQPSLMFVGKATGDLSEATFRCSTPG
jgi:hypothetical protein